MKGRTTTTRMPKGMSQGQLEHEVDSLVERPQSAGGPAKPDVTKPGSSGHRVAALEKQIAEETAAENGDKTATSIKGLKTLSDEEKRSKVSELIEELQATTETDDKKRIRRKLRALGHYGGLRAITNPASTVSTIPTSPVTVPPAEAKPDVSAEVVTPAKPVEAKPAKQGKRAVKALKQ